MYVDEESIVICRKNKDKDDEGPISKKVLKKQKKNLNKTLQASSHKEEFIKQQDRPNRTMEEEPPKPKNKKGPDRMIKDIKAILSNHKEETILRVLQKHNFNK